MPLKDRKKVVRCIRVADDKMILLRKLNDGQVWTQSFQWWYDTNVELYMYETWAGIDDPDVFVPEETRIQEFQTELEMHTHLWYIFGGQSLELRIESQ